MNVYQKHFYAVGAGISSGPAKRGIPSSEAAQIILAKTEFFLLIVGVLSNLFNTEIQLTHLCLARVNDQKKSTRFIHCLSFQLWFCLKAN